MSKKKMNWKQVAQTAELVATIALEAYLLQQIFKLGVNVGFALAKSAAKD